MVLFCRLPLLNVKYNSLVATYNFFSLKSPPWNVLFFGTDNFSLYSLKVLHKELLKGHLLKKLDIVTTTKCETNPVLKFAQKFQLNLHSWPCNEPKNNFDVGLVVSFGHLIPENVINWFPYGMLNIHASLLPRWRGAAPIIYALAKGDTETGVTIMQIKPHHFDVGDIVYQEKISINKDVKMPQLYEELGIRGADCLIKVLRNLEEYLEQTKPQSNEGVTFAPKISSEFGEIDWSKMSSTEVYNLSRAVEGYMSVTSTWKNTLVKFYDVRDCENNFTVTSNRTLEVLRPGFACYDKKTKHLMIACCNYTWISVGKIAVFRKKIMSAQDFNNGYVKKASLENRYFE